MKRKPQKTDRLALSFAPRVSGALLSLGADEELNEKESNLPNCLLASAYHADLAVQSRANARPAAGRGRLCSGPLNCGVLPRARAIRAQNHWSVP